MSLIRTRKLMLFMMSFAALVLLTPNLASARPAVQQDNSTDSAVEGNSYTSPAFGYAVTWNRDWSVSDEQNDADYNKLVLDNGTATVYFEGIVDPSDLDTCVQQLVSSLEKTEGVSKVAQMENSDGPIGGSEAGSSWAVYTLTYTNGTGDSIDFAEYIDCRPIVEGQSLLVITMLVPAADLQSQIDPLSELLSGLSMDGSSGPSDNGDNTGDTGTSTTAPSDKELENFVQISARDIDEFWTREFPLIANGKAYKAPADVVAFSDSVDTDCGAVKVGEVGPFYCPGDSTVYYDLAFGQYQVETFGSTSVIAVAMAHEIGHHIQNLMQWKECEATPCLDPTQMTSQEFELQADCFAGAWVADAETRGRLGSFDVETNIAQFALFLGDEGVGNTADAGAHGKGARRVYEFLNGYYNGVLECLTLSAASDPTRNGGATNNGAEPTEEATEEATAEATEETGSATSAQIGDDFDISFKDSAVTMNVTSTETTDSLGAGIDAKGTYLIVYFSLSRDAATAGPFPYSNFVVTDSDGNEYEFDADATDALLKTSDTLPDGIEQEIESGTTYNLAIVFDVDVNASGFTFSDTLGNVEVELDI